MRRQYITISATEEIFSRKFMKGRADCLYCLDVLKDRSCLSQALAKTRPSRSDAVHVPNGGPQQQSVMFEGTRKHMFFARQKRLSAPLKTHTRTLRTLLPSPLTPLLTLLSFLTSPITLFFFFYHPLSSVSIRSRAAANN